MTYKDMTFCPADCATVECIRNKANIDYAHVEKVNLPICWFVDKPVDCADYSPSGANSASETSTMSGAKTTIIKL